MGRLRAMPARLAAPPPRVASAPKVADDLYGSREWRALVAQIKRERGAFCQRCGSGGRLIGDHVVELRDGGAPLDPDNVELLCAARCHPAKTAAARRKRAMGQAR